MKPQSRFLIAIVCCMAATLMDSRAQARGKTQEKVQVATVTAVERVVEKQTGGEGAFVAVKDGGVLNAGDAVRTGKRSKAELVFQDKSMLRLGQLSLVQIQIGNSGGTRIQCRLGASSL